MWAVIVGGLIGIVGGAIPVWLKQQSDRADRLREAYATALGAINALLVRCQTLAFLQRRFEQLEESYDRQVADLRAKGPTVRIPPINEVHPEILDHLMREIEVLIQKIEQAGHASFAAHLLDADRTRRALLDQLLEKLGPPIPGQTEAYLANIRERMELLNRLTEQVAEVTAVEVPRLQA